MSPSKKSKTSSRRRRDSVRAYSPGLQDFKRRGTDSSRTNRADSDRERVIASQRALQTRRMDDIFGTFRRHIEDMMTH
jgi:hypothetical protein